MRTRWLARIFVFLFLILATDKFFAQSNTSGALVGTIADRSGAVVAGATITLNNPATGQTRTTRSDGHGLYRFSLLAPGFYAIEAQSDAFSPARKNAIEVTVANTTSVNLVLSVGGRKEEVVVSGQAQLVQSESTTLGSLVDGKTIETLPLSTRNYTQILDLSAGVQADVNNAGNLGRNTQDVYVNGARSVDNNFQMDGVEVNNFGTGRGGDWLGYSGIPIPNPDAVQEFNVQTSLYDAGYGRGAGANVNVVTKSGTNHLHGNLFESFRNDKLNANDYFLKETAQARAVLKQNQFGFTLGGPIARNRLFFFTSYQGTRQSNGVGSSSSSSAILPAALTSARDRATLGAAFGGTTSSGTIASDGTNISSVALALLNAKLPSGAYLIPTPQLIQSDGNGGTEGYSSFTDPSRFTEDQYVVTLDYLPSARQSFSLHGFVSDDPQRASFTTNALELPGSGAQSNFRNRSFLLKHTFIVNTHAVNEAHLSFNRNYGRMNSLVPLKDSDVGLTQPSDVTTLPIIGISGLFNIGGTYNDDFLTAINSLQIGDQFSLTLGRHSLRFGAGFDHAQDNFNLPGVKRGTLAFLSFEDFLLGQSGAENGTGTSNIYSSSAEAGIADRHFRVSNFEGFVQDDIKLTPRLTVNAGLRWEAFGGLSEKDGRLVNFWPTDAGNDFSSGSTYSGYVVANNFKATIPAGVAKTGNNTANDEAVSWGNLGPRIGLAWKPLPQNDKFVVRTGYGIYSSRTSGNNVLQLLLEPPYVASLYNVGTANVDASFSNPWGAGLPAASEFPVWSPRTIDGGAYVQNVEKHWTTPRTQQWNLNVQYELRPQLLIEVGYVGTRGQHLVTFRLPDQANLASASAPINGVTSNTVDNAYLRVPVLGFSPSGIWQVETEGNSFYNGLQATLTERLSHGVQFKLAYTFSKTLDDVPTSSPNLYTNSTGYTSIWGGLLVADQNNRRSSWGVSEFDRAQRFVASYQWQIPQLRHGASTLRAAVNGWQLAGVTTVQTGNALTIYDLNSGTIYGMYYGPAQRNTTSNTSIATQGSNTARLNNWFNDSAFTDPVVIGDGYGFGNSRRGIVRGPGQDNTDLSLVREIRLPIYGAGQRLELRAESFNLFNHAQFANPITTRGSGFGQITSTAVMARLLQLAAKISF
jgi:hypothetical protein